jgi:hypothetical protein
VYAEKQVQSRAPFGIDVLAAPLGTESVCLGHGPVSVSREVFRSVVAAKNLTCSFVRSSNVVIVTHSRLVESRIHQPDDESHYYLDFQENSTTRSTLLSNVSKTIQKTS